MTKLTDLSDLKNLFPGSGDEESETEHSQKPDRATSMVTLDIRRETKGRRGKGVTVIRGFHHCPEHLERIAKKLKSTCGAGGTVKRDSIEIQGDHRQKVAELLQKEGFNVKVIKS